MSLREPRAITDIEARGRRLPQRRQHRGRGRVVQYPPGQINLPARAARALVADRYMCNATYLPARAARALVADPDGRAGRLRYTCNDAAAGR